MQLSDVEGQTLQAKGFHAQKSGTATRNFRETQTENILGPFFNNSKIFPNATHETANHTTATVNGEDTIPPPAVTTPPIEKM